MKKIVMTALVAIVIMVSNPVMAGQLRLAGYYDVEREQRTITLDGYSQLSENWSTWGFVDFCTNQGNQENVADNADTQSFFGKGTVSYLLWQIDQIHSLKLTAELIDSSWANSQVRPGLQWMVYGQQGFMSFKVLPVTFDLVTPEEEIPQVGAIGGAWNLNMTDKLFWEGFWEMSFAHEHQDRHFPFIGETQLGYRMFEEVNVLVEYRYNNFMEDDHGLGLGAEFIF